MLVTSIFFAFPSMLSKDFFLGALKNVIVYKREGPGSRSKHTFNLNSSIDGNQEY